jgi:TRAP-type C4-dicarboxylate transport system substrate-binding protein
MLLVSGCTTQTTTTTQGSTPDSSETTDKTITLIFAIADAADSFIGTDFLQPWFAELEERTGGKVKIEAHWNGELVPLPEVYDSVVKGTVDIAQHLTTMPAGKFPMDDIGSFTSYDVYCPQYSRIIWELHQEFPEMQEAYHDTKVLCIIDMYPYFLCTTQKAGPVRTIEDNKGLKELVFGEWQGARGEALGRIPVSVLPPETYTSLEKGVLDCWQPNINMVRDFGVGKLLPYITLIPGPTGPFTFVMNLDTWNSLPADVQQVMDDMSEELVDKFDSAMLTMARECIASYPQEFGTEFITLSPEDVAKWVEADIPVKEAFIDQLEDKGLPGQELMDEFLRLEQKYSVSWDEYIGK